MAGAGEVRVPRSPETQSPEVREELEQSQVSHEGTQRSGDEPEPGTASHFGAVETEVTPTTPPMRGPADLVGDEQSDDTVDPADEITPG